MKATSRKQLEKQKKKNPLKIMYSWFTVSEVSVLLWIGIRCPGIRSLQERLTLAPDLIENSLHTLFTGVSGIGEIAALQCCETITPIRLMGSVSSTAQSAKDSALPGEINVMPMVWLFSPWGQCKSGHYGIFFLNCFLLGTPVRWRLIFNNASSWLCAITMTLAWKRNSEVEMFAVEQHPYPSKTGFWFLSFLTFL